MPTPIQLLTKRKSGLDDLLADANSIPGDGPRKRKLIEQIRHERDVVGKELRLRQIYADQVRAAGRDPDPGPQVPAGHAAWQERENQRQALKSMARGNLADLRAANKQLYGAGGIAEPCLKCDAAAIAKLKKNPDDKNKLVEVEFLEGFTSPSGNGHTDPILSGTGIQWVNLQDFRTRFERKFLPNWLKKIDNVPVTTFDRLSRKVRVRVKFQKPRVEHFLVKLEPAGKNLKYKDAERGANAAHDCIPNNGKAEPAWLEGYTDADGIAVVELHVRTCGGDTWKVKGRDDYGTKKTSSGKIETTRGMYVCTVTMAGVSAVALGDVRKEFLRHKIHVEIAELGGGVGNQVAHRTYLYCDSRKAAQKQLFESRVRTAVRAGTFKGVPPADLAPYLVVAHFYDQSPAVSDFTHRPVMVFPDRASNYPLSHFLWDPNDTVDWFIEAKAFRVVNGQLGDELVPAPTKANFTPIGSDAVGYKTLTFDPPAAYAGETDIALRVKTKIINGGINGFSIGAQGGSNFVAICRRTRYEDRGSGELNQTVVHELGHKVNFTTGPEPTGAVNPVPNRGVANDAVFRWLDASPTHYVGRGHNGGHCYKGAKSNADGSVATALQASFSAYDGHCVMFGSGGAGSKRKINFCGNCAERIVKLDIEQGWPSL